MNELDIKGSVIAGHNHFSAFFKNAMTPVMSVVRKWELRTVAGEERGYGGRLLYGQNVHFSPNFLWGVMLLEQREQPRSASVTLRAAEQSAVLSPAWP